MLPRFLVISKYELKQYRASIADEAIILLVLLAGFMMLMTPEVEQSLLPSSHKIYRIGYLEGSVIGEIDSYTLDFVPYQDKYEMMYASNIEKIDAFAIMGRDKMVFFGSGTKKSESALNQLNLQMKDFNMHLVAERALAEPHLSGILLPLRLDIVGEEIDYLAAMNGTVDMQRKQLLGARRAEEVQEAQKLNEGPAPELVISTQASMESEDLPEPAPIQAAETEESLSLPAELAVEFPFKTLYKNMTLLSPLIMLSILLSLSLSKERIDRNMENLFIAPLSRWEIVLGKSLPYMAVMAALSLAFGFQATMTAQALKVALVFAALSATMLSFSLFSVVISRSYRELTFIGSFALFAFFFFIVLPNVFSGVNVLAFISPLDTVTSIENGAMIPYTDIFLSLLPYLFMSMFFTTFAGICFNPELMFASRDFYALLNYFYEALSRMMGHRHLFVVAAVSLLVPFIFIIESILAYLVLPMGFFAPIISLILLATVEELTKIVPFHFQRMNPLKYGLIAGASFFLCEKMFNLYLVYKVYSFLGGPYAYFLSRMAPTLLVHMASTSVFAILVYYGKRRIWYVLGLFISVIMHVIYNVAVLRGAI